MAEMAQDNLRRRYFISQDFVSLPFGSVGMSINFHFSNWEKGIAAGSLVNPYHS